MFFVAVRSFLKLCRYRKAFAILSGLSLAITALSFLVLVEKGLYNYQYSLSQEYVFAESAVSEDIISIYNDIISSKSLPEIVSISLIDEQCTGISCEASQFQMFIPYGRLFSQDEMEEGRNVALLSLEYIRNLPQEKADHIWDEGIEIDETHFDAVGGYTDIARYFPLSELAFDFPMPTFVAMPAKTYLASGREPVMLNCHFADILSKEQQNMLSQMISSYESVDNYYIPGTRESIKSSLLKVLSTYSAILLMSLVAVVLIIIYWFRSERERYRVYMVCGAKKRHIIFFCTINILLLSLISYLAALAGLELINLGFEGMILVSLPAIWRLLIGVGIFAFCWIVVVFRSLSLLNHDRNVSSAEVA